MTETMIGGALASPHASTATSSPQDPDASRVSWLGLTFLLLPLLVMVGAFGWLAVAHRTLRLWDVVVHEGGRYTLGQTVFYFEHLLRELPVLLGYVLFLVAEVARLPGRARGQPTSAARRLALAAMGGATLVLAVAMAGAAARSGVVSALQDLGQYRTRDDLPLAYGSHWHIHWLSTLWFGLAAPWAVRLWAGLAGERLTEPRNALRWAAWLYFALLTLLFGTSLAVFFDVRYAGHQAREIFTHALVTLPLAIAAAALAHRRIGRRVHGSKSGGIRGARSAASTARPPRLRVSLTRQLVTAAAVLLPIPAFLALITFSGDLMAAGQSQGGLTAMVGAHFFEHSLDYLLVTLLVVGAQPWAVGALPAAARKPRSRS